MEAVVSITNRAKECQVVIELCVTDLLHAVNDDSTSWVQRVKLVRYAWISEDVMLLNKKQVLTNILFSTVSPTRGYHNLSHLVICF